MRRPALRALRDQLRRCPWVELKLGPGEDRLQVGAAMEREARELDAAGEAEEALEGFQRAVAVFKLVYNFDPRSKSNPKIKEMVGNRIAELETLIKLRDPGYAEAQAAPTESSSADDLEARLARLRQ
ncbi:unnamed protein product [Effrenium voratum]|nr:unnamed protein product [Effrenium voratum]CAJ1456022.1 unnamed protein product [Effrenium voratum]